jgi:hypothetical protein
VAPQVFRISLRINPILVILSLLIGFQIYGVPGALLALPVAAVLRETTLYLRRHLVLEPWGPQAAALGLVGSASAPEEGEATAGDQPSQAEQAAPADEPSAEPSPQEEALAGEPSPDASPEPRVTRASPTPPEADVETEPERAGYRR